MIYDLNEMINDYLKKNNLRCLNTAEEDAIDNIVSSTYPELEGLTLINAKNNDVLNDDDYIKLFAVSRYSDRRFSINLYDSCVEVSENVDDKNNFYLKYDIHDEKVTDLVYTKDNDIICYYYDDNNRTAKLYLYTNCANQSIAKDRCEPTELLFDYDDEIKMVSSDSGVKCISKDKKLFVENKSYTNANSIFLNKLYTANDLIKARSICENVRDEYYRVYPNFSKRMRLSK